MMKIADALLRIRSIEYPADARPVDSTVAEELRSRLAPQANITACRRPRGIYGFRVFVADERFSPLPQMGRKVPRGSDWTFFRIDEDGDGELVASSPHLLYALLCRIEEDWRHEDVADFARGRFDEVTFRWQRPLFDMFLTQVYRTARGWDRESYVRELARLGYSHVEVNGLAAPLAYEQNATDEVLYRFFTYCPALDQFTESWLNKGTYPAEHLAANLNFLKTNAALAVKYGLTPALLCFEPRAVPESLLNRYPMLRGARVDHPFRSFRPRFNLTIAHPAVRAHYAEMMRNLLKEVPQIGALEIWSNDSGAGFEHTCSLYVGRNGGPYLIREWKTHEQVAETASMNVVRFLNALRDGAAEINPDFRVIVRIDPFWSEREHILKGLGGGLDVETSTFAATDFGTPYRHPRYNDVPQVGLTAYHHGFDERERGRIESLRKRGVHAHIGLPHGPFCNFDPLLGIPFPRLVHDKLTAMSKVGVDRVAQIGGIVPPDLAPWSVNNEVWRAFQFERSTPVDTVMRRVAVKWVGEGHAGNLVKAWKLTEDAIRAYPIPAHLYTIWGILWYRLWVRPLVPDYDRIPEADRAYYEKFMCSTEHNPTRVDLAKDVLFDVTTPAYCLKSVGRIDRNLWEPLDRAMGLLSTMKEGMPELSPARAVAVDLHERLKALRCWFRTQRNYAAWIAGVHGYIESKSATVRKGRRSLVRTAVLDELENAKVLLRLWEESPVEFMSVSSVGETTFIHGDNFGDLLKLKIKLMKGRENDEPRIDGDYMWKKSCPGYGTHWR
jgi:hypothetical protein